MSGSMKFVLTAMAALGVSATLSAAEPQIPVACSNSMASAVLEACVNKVFEDEWAWRAREFGGSETDANDGELAGHLPTVNRDSQLARRAYWEQILKRLSDIDPTRLPTDSRDDLEIFRFVVQTYLDSISYGEYEIPFNSDTAFWTSLAPRGGFKSTTEYERYIGRIKDIPRYFDEQVANMRAGMARGFVAPRSALIGRDKAFDPYLAREVEANPLFSPFQSLPATMPQDERSRLTSLAKVAITRDAVPAYEKLRKFLYSEYIQAARANPSVASLPEGPQYYRNQILRYTTLELDPAAVHELGLAEVARIEAEMRVDMDKTGFKGTLPEFIAKLRADPRFYATSPEQLLTKAAWITKRVDGRLGEFIGKLPRHRFTIVPVPPEIAPFYTGGRGGLDACLFNTYALSSRPLYSLPSLAIHECNPGHSFQMAAALEIEGRPEFRRHVYFSGYSEGWALYAERLGVEMGIYETPYEDFGRLNYEIWRATRLVVDTGIHAKGWSRAQAIEYLKAHTALAEHEIVTEVDRYISWPGQALSYKIGELAIVRLRRDAERRLGEKFDIRRFHDVLLGLGSVPLPVLERRLSNY